VQGLLPSLVNRQYTVICNAVLVWKCYLPKGR